MLSSIPVLWFVTAAMGFLSGLGVGGGSLLILWLSLIMKLEYPVVRILNLLFFIPGAVIASLIRWKQGTLKVKTALPAIIFGCISAAIFTLFRDRIETHLLKKIFGVLLLFTGARELMAGFQQKPKDQRFLRKER